MKKSILIVIPAFNESKSIQKVIQDLQKHGYKDIVVIDDGSSDSTGELASACGSLVVRHLLNRGLGAGLGTGFAYGKKNQFDILITFDGDGQHRASDIKELIRPIIEGKFDVVIGSRFKNQNISMPKNRKVANLLSNIVTYLFYGVSTTDSQSGLRAFNRRSIEKIRIKTDRMEVSSEFFREIKVNGLKYCEIPIEAIYTKASLKGSKQGNIAISSIKIGFQILVRLFR